MQFYMPLMAEMAVLDKLPEQQPQPLTAALAEQLAQTASSMEQVILETILSELAGPSLLAEKAAHLLTAEQV
jgi:hypothetical protein